MREGKRKRAVICLSSSSSDDEEESEEESEEDEDRSFSDSSESSYASDCTDDEDEESDDEDDARNVEDGDGESLCNRVIRLLQEGRDLEGLHLKECKAYLRRHGLRISGTKAVCVKRIQEHWRIRDGNIKALYPRSSFAINCTGDVCKGDIVLFTQRVYEQFDKMRRRGNIIGKRTVAGRVVKESYGAAKQQHTFTGRNLYKWKTFRQRWSNEAERSKVLAEKHKRGAAARLVREMRRNKKILPADAERSKVLAEKHERGAAAKLVEKMRKKKKIQSADGGVNSQKHAHETVPSQRIKTNEAKKRKHVAYHRHGKPTSHQETPTFRQANHNRSARLGSYESSGHQVQTTYHRHGKPTSRQETTSFRHANHSQSARFRATESLGHQIHTTLNRDS